MQRHADDNTPTAGLYSDLCRAGFHCQTGARASPPVSLVCSVPTPSCVLYLPCPCLQFNQGRATQGQKKHHCSELDLHMATATTTFTIPCCVPSLLPCAHRDGLETSQSCPSPSFLMLRDDYGKTHPSPLSSRLLFSWDRQMAAFASSRGCYHPVATILYVDQKSGHFRDGCKDRLPSGSLWVCLYRPPIMQLWPSMAVRWHAIWSHLCC